MSRADLVFERGVVGRRLAPSLRFEELTIALTGKSTSITTVAWDYTLVEHGRRSVQVIFATWHWTNKLRSSKKNHFFDSTGPSVTIPDSRSRRAIRQSQTFGAPTTPPTVFSAVGARTRRGGGSTERASGDSKLVAAREFAHSVMRVTDPPWSWKSGARSIGRGGAPEGRSNWPHLRELVPPITSKATFVASAAQLGQQHTTIDE